MHHYALSALGRDQPGMVAALTEAMLDHGVNLGDSQMTILGGHFAMTVVLGAEDGLDRSALEADLRAAGERVGVEMLALERIDDRISPAPEASHTVTVYGSDHPGILHALAAAVARHGYDITDLNTRLSLGENGDPPLYVLMMEVATPAGHDEELASAMEEVAREQGVEVSVSPLEDDA